MLSRLRKVNLIAAYFLLVILGTVNSKEIMHSFVYHDRAICVEHEAESGHADDSIDTSISTAGKYCIFCHIDFSIFETPYEREIATLPFEHQIITAAAPEQIHLVPNPGSLLLRGPPAIV